MASSSKGRIKSISYAKYGYIFIAPFFIFYFLFSLLPLLQIFVLSAQKLVAPDNMATLPFTAWKRFAEVEFCKLDNFDVLFFDKELPFRQYFFDAFKNTVTLWVGNFIPQILLSLILAVWFTDSKIKIKGKGIFKVIVYMPNIITAASVAALFGSMFSSADGCAANIVLQKLGFEPIEFLSNKEGLFGFANSQKYVWFVQCWMWFGNTTLMLMSGIMGINESLFEAADIDGANSRQVFFRVTLPLLKPMMLYTLVTSLIGGLQMYDVPAIIGSLGGGSTIPSDSPLRTVTYLIKYYYELSDPLGKGLAGAVSVVLFIVTVILGTIIFFMYRDKDEIRKKKQLKKLKAQAKARAQGLGDFGI